MATPSDSDYLDQIIPAIREYSYGNKTSHLLGVLSDFAAAKEAEIEYQCNANHQEFVGSINQLLRIREGTVTLTNEILELNQAIQASTQKLVEQKKALVESRGVRRNIDEAKSALQDCLEVLRLANQVHDLLAQKKHYAALRALDELQSVHLQSITQYKLSETIQRSVPATQKVIAEAVMADLKTWLFRVREMSQYLGELSFYHTDLRKQRHAVRAEKTPYLSNFQLNSAIELVSDEHEEFDLLNTEDLQVDFTPLFEAVHIYQCLGQMNQFRSEYTANRRRQKELLLPSSITLNDDELANLHTLLEDIAGFAIMERATMRRVPDLRSSAEVEELWDSLCQTAISLISQALPVVDNAEHLLKVKNVMSLFMETMKSWSLQTQAMNNFLLTVFEQYADLLKRRYSDDFLEIVSTDDYMPMPIQNPEEFDKVVSVSWYTPDRRREEMSFPCVFPFSQMYPLCCIDIRNFLNQFYFFSTPESTAFTHTDAIDQKLRDSLDELLTTKVGDALIARLSSQYLGQIVQILINLEHFETACHGIESLLASAALDHNSRGVSLPTTTSAHAKPATALKATAAFATHKFTATSRIYSLINSKLTDLIDSADYDWLPAPLPPNESLEESPYLPTLTQYLTNISSTVLLSLPPQLKQSITYKALAHTASSILSLLLSSQVPRINQTAIRQLLVDVAFLQQFAESLPQNNISDSEDQPQYLNSALDELCQSIALLSAPNSEEFYEIGVRQKKYRAVDPLKGPILLEKVVKDQPAQSSGGVSRNTSGGGRSGINGPGPGVDSRGSGGGTMGSRAGEKFAALRSGWGVGGS